MSNPFLLESPPMFSSTKHKDLLRFLLQQILQNQAMQFDQAYHYNDLLCSFHPPKHILYRPQKFYCAYAGRNKNICFLKKVQKNEDECLLLLILQQTSLKFFAKHSHRSSGKLVHFFLQRFSTLLLRLFPFRRHQKYRSEDEYFLQLSQLNEEAGQSTLYHQQPIEPC